MTVIVQLGLCGGTFYQGMINHKLSIRTGLQSSRLDYYCRGIYGRFTGRRKSCLPCFWLLFWDV